MDDNCKAQLKEEWFLILLGGAVLAITLISFVSVGIWILKYLF